MSAAASVWALARILLFALAATRIAAAAVIPIAEIAPELEPHAASRMPMPVPPAVLSGQWTGRAPDGSAVWVTLHVKGGAISGAAHFGRGILGRRTWTAVRDSYDGRSLSFYMGGRCPAANAARGAFRILSPSSAQLDVMAPDGTGQISITLSRAS